MKLQFLCGPHRQWLLANPKAALGAWQKACDNSTALLEIGNLAEATNYAGCAMETSDILLRHHTEPRAQDISRFGSNTVHLAKCLMALHEKHRAQTLLEGALVRLQGLLDHAPARQSMLATIEQMMVASQQLNLVLEPVPGSTVH